MSKSKWAKRLDGSHPFYHLSRSGVRKAQREQNKMLVSFLERPEGMSGGVCVCFHAGHGCQEKSVIHQYPKLNLSIFLQDRVAAGRQT